MKQNKTLYLSLILLGLIWGCSSDDNNNDSDAGENNVNNLNNRNNENNQNNANNLNNVRDVGVPDIEGDASSLIVNAGPDLTVPGGIRVPLDGSGSSGGTILWTQTGGQMLTIETPTDAKTFVTVPFDAQGGTSYAFELSVTGNSVVQDILIINVEDLTFENFLGGIADTQQLNSSEGIAFVDNRMWVISTQGFVSAFDSNGGFLQRFDIPGTPVGANIDATGSLVIANAANGTIDSMNLADGAISNIVGGLGTANYPLPDANGNVFVSNRGDQQVWRYDAVQQAAAVFVENIGNNPNSISFGPHADTLYATSVGRVFKVPINADGSAGVPEIYINLGSDQGITLEVDGLVFDEAGNAWIGCPNNAELFVAPFAETGEATVSRNWQNVSANNSFFVNLSFGSAQFGETTLHYTNLGDRTVGRFDIGLGAW